MRKFEIPYLSTEDEIGHNLMVASYQHVFFCKKVHRNEEIYPFFENHTWTPIRYISVEGLTKNTMKTIHVKGTVIEISFNFGL